jgi:hypothetical protein
MITKTYNPSRLELDFARAIKALKGNINPYIEGNEIVDIKFNEDQDNPDLIFKLKDSDGDKHEVVVRLIQRADDLVNR